ncbi:MAG: membrane protein insertion efficiency factor YidD [Candidatus Nanopelagicales bacterium]
MKQSLGRALHIIGLPFVWLLVGIIKVYQYCISPLLGPRCRFYPSCSTYAVDSLRHHGPIKGSLLAGYRICRCHPWQPGGLDPTPPKGAWRPDINPDGTPRNVVSTDHQLTDLGV